MKKKIHVCIDIGNQTFKIGAFAKKAKKLLLLKALVEKIDFTLSESFSETVPAITTKILEMLSKLDLKPQACTFSISLPSTITFCRLLKLPLVDRTKIHQMVQYEAQQQVPFSLEEVIWGYQVLGNPDETHLHVLMAAVRLEYVQTLLDSLSQHHLEIQRVEAAMIASYHCAFRLLETSPGTTAHINVGARSTSLTVFTKNTAWMRTITIGGEYFSQEIQKSTQGASLPTDISASLDQKIKESIATSSKRLVAELMRSTSYYNTQVHPDAIARFQLSGGGIQIPHLREALSQDLATPVEILDPLQTGFVDKFPSVTDDTPSYLFTEVIGLGFYLLKKSWFGINLLPKSYAQRQALAQKRNTVFLSAAIVVLIMAGQILYHKTLLKLEQSRLNGVSTVQKELINHSEQIKYYVQRSETLSNQISEIGKLAKERVLWLKIFGELEKLTPTNMWFDKLTTALIQESDSSTPNRSKGAPVGKMMVTLYCKTTGVYKDVSNFRDILDKSPLFQQAQIRSANPPLQGVRDFVIQVEVEE